MERVSLVLLPGMDGTGQLFEPFISALAGEFDITVVAYPASTALGYAELEAIAAKAIPAQGPYVILGESFSGPIAISLAAAAGARLKGLILCCTFARNPRPALSGLGPLLRFIPVGSMPMAVASHLLMGRFATPALRAALARSLAEVPPSVLRQRLSAVLAVDTSLALRAIRVPVLYLRALHDRLVPPEAAAWIAHIGCEVQMVAMDAPHALLQTVPFEAARVLVPFLRRVRIAGITDR